MNQPYIIRSREIRDRCAQRVEMIPVNPEKPMEVVIRPYKSKRSIDQNSCSWAIYTAIGSDLGYTPQEIHDLALDAFGGSHEVEVVSRKTGEVWKKKVLNMGTSKMTVREMSDFITWLIAWGQDLIEGDLRPVAAEYDWRYER